MLLKPAAVIACSSSPLFVSPRNSMRLEELFARSSIEVLGGRLWQPHEEAPAAAEAPPKRSPVLPSAAADEESPVRRKAAPAVIAKDLSCASVLAALFTIRCASFSLTSF